MLTATLRCLGTRTPHSGGPTVYRAICGEHEVEGVEPVRPLCRVLLYHGHSGTLALHDADTGKLRSTIARLEEAARWSLQEGEHGIRKRRWQPHPQAPAWEVALEARLRLSPGPAEAAPALG